MLAHLVDRHDMGMVEPGDRLGLDAEPLDRVGTGPECRRPDRLEGHDPAEALLPGFENDAHPADGDLLDQLEVAEIAADSELGVGLPRIAPAGRRSIRGRLRRTTAASRPTP